MKSIKNKQIMKEKIYLKGNKFHGGEAVLCPLPSSCILFYLRYCQTQQFEVVFIPDENLISCCSRVSLSSLPKGCVTFLCFDDVPTVVRNVCLPSVHQAELSLVRAGLCVVLRHIIKTAHVEAPEKKLIDLLGFRQGSMKMCSEVSGWTKLCEVDLPDSIAAIIQSLKEIKKAISSHPESEANLTVPLDLIKLEEHFKKKCLIHNDNKKKRADLQRLKTLLSSFGGSCLNTLRNGGSGNSDDKTQSILNSCTSPFAAIQSEHKVEENGFSPGAYFENLSISSSILQIQHLVKLSHGVRRLKVEKVLNKIPASAGMDISELEREFSTLYLEKDDKRISDDYLTKAIAIPGLTKLVEDLTFTDIEYVHTYSEGIEMTLADLILFVYIYFLLEQLNFNCSAVQDLLPNVLQWLEHMVLIPSIFSAGQILGWNMSDLTEGLRNMSGGEIKDVCTGFVSFTQPEYPTLDEEDEMELSRYTRMKHKAIKPEVLQVFKRLEDAKIKPCRGEHPRGENVTVAWDSLPSGIHPREGDVPEKRTMRKCQQLENLATAVQAVVKEGDVIVDFCCGGGHLGIVLAYLLPHCQVYLVENKEESLLKVCSRLESLELTNVALYQCNIDYFLGKFDVGVCLHACGSATDMVQELCLNAGAAFVICPCCYGSIQKTHLLMYPRSKQFQSSNISYKEYLTLGHAADQTEFNIALEEQGRESMNMVDSDRAAYAKELGYQVSLCSLQPLSCTPKNNLLIGTPAGFHTK